MLPSNWRNQRFAAPTVITARAVESPEDRGGFSLRDLLQILFSRKWTILLFFAGTMATVAAVSAMLSKPMYQARAQILVSPDRDEVANLTMPTPLATRGFSYDEQTARAIELLVGRFLAERVVRSIGSAVLYPKLPASPLAALPMLSGPPLDEQGLLEKAVDRFLENVDAELVGKSSIVSVGFKHEDAAMAARVVNLLCDAYVERNVSLQKNPRTDAFFQEQFDILQRKVRDGEARLKSLRTTYGISSAVKDEQELVLRQQVALRTSLNETRSKEAEVDSRVAKLREQMDNTMRNPAVAERLRDQLTTLELQESELSTRYTPENPTLHNLRDQIRSLRAKLTDLEATKQYGTVVSREGSLYAALQEALLHNEAEARALRARDETQTAKLAEFQARLDSLGHAALEFEAAERQVQSDQQTYRLYMTKFDESRISSAMDAEKIASVRVIESAHPPNRPLNSKVRLTMMLGLLFGAMGGVALALIQHFASGCIASIGDVEGALEMPVLASIPQLPIKRA